jgi:hypothetical protein
MATDTPTPSKVAGFFDDFKDLAFDYARAKYIDVERGDEDRNIPDITTTAPVAAATPGPVSMGGFSLDLKTAGLAIAGLLGLLLIVRRV